MNPRLRTAIQAAKQANMPKDNISRAISKSEMSGDKNYESLRYEGFGPSNVAFIIETLTDNKKISIKYQNSITKKWWKIRRNWLDNPYVFKLWNNSGK